MKRELNIILEELRRLKEEGVAVVNVSEETVAQLRDHARKMTSGSAVNTEAVGQKDPEAKLSRIRSRFEPAGSGRLPDFNPGPDTLPKVSAKPSTPVRKLPPPPSVTLPKGDKKAQWEALRKQVLECPTCKESLKPGCKVVFGVGNLDADIFFVGEAPGADEEQAGEPFVGKAGELLTKMIGAMGISREDVYIGNIMNWRPDTGTGAGNRPPTQEEMQFCLPYLLAQIEIVKPKVLVALGNTAVSGLLGADPKRKMKDVRGQWKEFQGIPVMVTYHPAYLVRNASNAVKRTVWEDLLQVMEKVGLEISDRQRGYFLPKQ